MVERSRRRRDMIKVTITRMLLSSAALAAIAALFAGGANAMVQEPSGHPPPVGDSAVKVDRAVAAANEAYDTYRDKAAIAARAALLTDQQPSVGLTGDSALTRSLCSSGADALVGSSVRGAHRGQPGEVSRPIPPGRRRDRHAADRVVCE